MNSNNIMSKALDLVLKMPKLKYKEKNEEKKKGDKGNKKKKGETGKKTGKKKKGEDIKNKLINDYFPSPSKKSIPTEGNLPEAPLPQISISSNEMKDSHGNENQVLPSQKETKPQNFEENLSEPPLQQNPISTNESEKVSERESVRIKKVLDPKDSQGNENDVLPHQTEIKPQDSENLPETPLQQKSNSSNEMEEDKLEREKKSIRRKKKPIIENNEEKVPTDTKEVDSQEKEEKQLEVSQEITENQDKETKKSPKTTKKKVYQKRKRTSTKKPQKKRKLDKVEEKVNKREKKDQDELPVNENSTIAENEEISVSVDLINKEEGNIDLKFKIVIKKPKSKEEELDDLLNYQIEGVGPISVNNSNFEKEIEISELIKEKKEREIERKKREKIFKEIEEMGPPNMDYPIFVQNVTIVQKFFTLFNDDHTDKKKKNLKNLTKENLLEVVAFNDNYGMEAFLKIKDEEFDWENIEKIFKKFGYNGKLIEVEKEYDYTTEQLSRIHLLLQLIKNSVTEENSVEIFNFVFLALKDKKLKFLMDFKEIMNECILKTKKLEDLLIKDMSFNFDLLHFIYLLSLSSKGNDLQKEYGKFYLKQQYQTDDPYELLKIISAIFSKKNDDISFQDFEKSNLAMRFYEICFIGWDSEHINEKTIEILEGLEVKLKKFSNTFSYFKLTIVEILAKMKLLKNREYN